MPHKPTKDPKKEMEILPPIAEEISDDLRDFATELFKDCPEVLGHILDPNSEWGTRESAPRAPQKSLHPNPKFSKKGQSR